MKAIILLVCLALIVTGCKKNSLTPSSIYRRNQAELVGYNAGMCQELSCSGMIIHIDNDTTSKPPPYYLYNGTLSNLNISNALKFPINVTLSWKRDTGIYGSFNFIVISKIELR